VHNDEIHKVLKRHKFTGFGILILSFVLLTWVWVRKYKFKKGEYITWVLFLVLGTAAVFYQGFLGGKMVFEQGAGVKPMEQFMEHGGDSKKPHSHSNSEHEHSNAADTASVQKTIPEKTKHDHSATDHDDANKQDTSKKQDNKQPKEKKKELKDMKY
jgi:apolipoprotein N-acyltransferase